MDGQSMLTRHLLIFTKIMVYDEQLLITPRVGMKQPVSA